MFTRDEAKRGHPVVEAEPEYFRVAACCDSVIATMEANSLYRDVPSADAFQQRFVLAKQYAWAIPSTEVLGAIAAWSPLCEIGAGTGYWAALLAGRGADIVAYDPKPGHNEWVDHGLYYPVAAGDWHAVRRHQDRTLFLCWPTMDRWAEWALRLYRGSRVVYIGEWEGGCCANDRFFELLACEWREVAAIRIPQWWGLHDRCWLYERRAANHSDEYAGGGPATHGQED